jgi:glycosyltransferase involved in cell wall biosynthesis
MSTVCSRIVTGHGRGAGKFVDAGRQARAALTPVSSQQTVRVLHITPSVRLLGARKSLLTLVAELAGTRYDPLVLVPEAGALTEELDKRGLPWRALRLPPWRKGASWFVMGQRIAALREIIREERVGLIHCNEIYPTPHALCAAAARNPWLDALAALANGRPTTPIGLPIVTHMRLSVSPGLIRKYLLEQSTRIIAVSHAAAQDFHGCTWKDRKVRVVYNGLDFADFEAASQRRALARGRIGLREDDFVVGQIGLLMPRKRPAFLIEMLARLRVEVPHAKLLFVGESSPGHREYLDVLKAQAAAAGLGDAVIFVPFQRNIADYFAALDVNMLMSNDEGFGRVIIEAAAAGVPTIGSNTGGIPELIRHGETGWIVGPRNASDEVFSREVQPVARLLADLAHNAEQTRSIGAAAKAHAREAFSSTTYARACAAVFDEAMQEFRRR